MRLVRMVVFALLLVALVIPATAAAGGPPLDLEMSVPTVFAEPGMPDGTFTVKGPALDAGLVCETGDTYVIDGKGPKGLQSDRLFNLYVMKRFVCDDGSGSFFVKLQVHYDFAKTPEYNVFNWTIKGGTGDYENLRGSGSGMGLYFGDGVPENGVLDMYEGKIH